MSLGTRKGITLFEYGYLMPDGGDELPEVSRVPDHVFTWLENQCLLLAERQETAWLRLTQRHGRRAVQVTSYVGVLRAPDGFQIEILPKVGKAMAGGDTEARERLVEMLGCLTEVRHLRTDRARLASRRMPLLEVFIGEFLRAVEQVIKRGLQSDYCQREGQLQALRGKLLIASHLRENIVRRDRFFTAHDEFSPDRPENRLLHTALRRVLSMAASTPHQRLAREYTFVFAGIPESADIGADFQRVRMDRNMGHYAEALAWARLILAGHSPLTGAGGHLSPSLLFPMEVVFEAYVAHHLARRIPARHTLTAQAKAHHLVRHAGREWFLLMPDLVVRENRRPVLLLDTKWKLLDSVLTSSRERYGLSQADFYQLFAYGQSYLGGTGDVALIYPRTERFKEPLPAFEFPAAPGLRLWVLPFCLNTRSLLLPPNEPFSDFFKPSEFPTNAGISDS